MMQAPGPRAIPYPLLQYRGASGCNPRCIPGFYDSNDLHVCCLLVSLRSAKIEASLAAKIVVMEHVYVVYVSGASELNIRVLAIFSSRCLPMTSALDMAPSSFHAATAWAMLSPSVVP